MSEPRNWRKVYIVSDVSRGLYCDGRGVRSPGSEEGGGKRGRELTRLVFGFASCRLLMKLVSRRNWTGRLD